MTEAGDLRLVGAAAVSVGGGMLIDVVPRFSSPDLVGRDGELALLHDALERVSAGETATLLLGGEAGIGKTRLVEEFARSAADSGATLLVGRCVELGEEGLAYAPISGALRMLVDRIGESALAEAAGAGWPTLSRILPGLGLVPPAEGEDESGRVRLFEVITSLLERLSDSVPHVLIIEDLHWADRSTRDLLRFLIGSVRGARLLVLITFRSDEIHRSHPLRPYLAELERIRRVQRLELGRLDRAGVGAQLRGILERDVDSDLVRRIFSRSEGIPFFVEELARADAAGECGLTQSLRDLLLVRLEGLSPTTQQLLRIMAAGGVRVDHALLAAVSGFQPEQLDAALREAIADNLLVVDSSRRGYAFRHALLREAIHDDLLPGEHSRLHIRFAEVLEANPGLFPPPRAAVEIAHHWHAANDVKRAFGAAINAARESANVYAYAEAHRKLERALALWDQVPDAEEVARASRLDVIAHAAAAAQGSGELERALALLESALDGEGVAPDTPTRAALLARKSKLLSRMGRPGANEALDAAAALVPADPPSRELAQVLSMRAGMLMVRGVFAESLDVARRAIEVSRAVGAVKYEGAALNAMGCAMISLGQVQEGLATLEESRRLALEIHDDEGVLQWHGNTSDALVTLGRFDRAAEIARQGLHLARERGLSRTSGAFLAGNLAEALFAMGSWQELDEVLDGALDLHPPARTSAHLHRVRATLRLARGDLAGSREDVEAASLPSRRGALHAQDRALMTRTQAELAMAEGEFETAWDLLQPLLEQVTKQWHPEASRIALASAGRALGELARRARMAGDESRLEWAIAEAARLRRLSQQIGRIPGTVEQWIALLEAELAEVDGVSDARPWRHLTEIAARPTGWPYVHAYGLLRLARVLLTRGDRAAAGQAIDAASEVVDRLGADLLRSDIEQLSRRARIGLADPGRAAMVRSTEERLGLTPRELQVLRLLSTGRTNRQIAAELFISPKTASVHVSNILAKLGVSGRGEAAALAHREGLLDDRQPA